MIKLTLYNDSDIILNVDLIEFIEHTPDTLVTLTTGKKIMVKEPVEDVVRKVITYRRLINRRNRLTIPHYKQLQKGTSLWTARQ